MDFTLCTVLVHKAFKKNGKKAISRDWFSDQRGKFLFKICWAESCWRDCSCKLGRLAHVLWAVLCSVLVRWGQSWKKAWRSFCKLNSYPLSWELLKQVPVRSRKKWHFHIVLDSEEAPVREKPVLSWRIAGASTGDLGWSQSTNRQHKTPNFQIFVFGPVV